MSPTRAFIGVILAHMDGRPDDWRVVKNGDEIVNEATGVSIYIWGGYLRLEVNGARMDLPIGCTGKLRRAVNKLLARQAVNKFKATA